MTAASLHAIPGPRGDANAVFRAGGTDNTIGPAGRFGQKSGLLSSAIKHLTAVPPMWRRCNSVSRMGVRPLATGRARHYGCGSEKSGCDAVRPVARIARLT